MELTIGQKKYKTVNQPIRFADVPDKYIIIHGCKWDAEIPFYSERWRSLFRIMSAAPEQPVSITINTDFWFSINLQS